MKHLSQRQIVMSWQVACNIINKIKRLSSICCGAESELPPTHTHAYLPDEFRMTLISHESRLRYRFKIYHHSLNYLSCVQVHNEETRSGSNGVRPPVIGRNSSRQTILNEQVTFVTYLWPKVPGLHWLCLHDTQIKYYRMRHILARCAPTDTWQGVI